MSFADEIGDMDATAQAELVKKGEVKPVELVEAAIERIERWNPLINAVVTRMFDRALDEARGHIPEGPFKGVPFLLKDLLASCQGVPLTMGAQLMRDFVPREDSELVKRIKQAGLIIVGKTNTPELGILPTTEPMLFGLCRNPWNLGLTSGGSSGGSAAAVAVRMVPMAHGNDGGGSIRIPASCCGVFGLKPTRARNPLGPNFGDLMNGLVVEHALTVSVRDSARLLDATSGPDLGDPYWPPLPSRPFSEEVGADPGELRVAFTHSAPAGLSVHPECIEAVKEGASLCEALGHKVEEASPEIQWEIMNGCFMVLWSSGCASTMEAIARMKGRPLCREDVEPTTWILYEIGKKQLASDYLLAVQTLQVISRQISRFFQKYDVWITPTVSQPPLPLGSFEPTDDDPLRGLRKAAQFVPFTPICNITGQPAMSLPIYWSEDGLPIGVHFVGRFGDEATLLRLASQIEAARPWARRKPKPL